MNQLIETLPLWLWGGLAVLALFLGRGPSHRAIYSLARFGHRSLLFAATSIGLAGQRVRERNREVLLAMGREMAEWQIEREFERIEGTLKRDLAQYPTLHRRLCEQMTVLDEDYVRSAEIPPEPSNWARAIRSVAEIPTQDDTVVADVLETINQSMRKAESRALESYREAIRERHQLLKRMMPGWRTMLKTLGRINRNVESLIYRGKVLDGHMARYEEILQESDRSLRLLSISSLNRFLVSSLVLFVALAGVWVNHQLIARPITEIVGDGHFLGTYATADITALVLIFLQLVTGIVVIESLRITRLFPSIGALADIARRRLMWAALLLLLCFAGIEAGLSFSRELLLQQDQSMTGVVAISGPVVAGMDSYWTLGLAQLGLGFILPLALAFTAIPLEQFVASARTVFGFLLLFFLNLVSVCLRFLAVTALHCGILLNRLYDLIIFLPLWLQRVYLHSRKTGFLTAQPDTTVSGQGAMKAMGEGLSTEPSTSV
ncbi:hypothetical protein [uncultured Microbulbifer sp.]|uniref:hypothetical protein n=1 Tax=uncultured Microbulbifer sp. TaxID=348147 RepID=UPI00260B5CF1|nr:hypothetical protein [uncultured Microbulbifer sp.]